MPNWMRKNRMCITGDPTVKRLTADGKVARGAAAALPVAGRSHWYKLRPHELWSTTNRLVVNLDPKGGLADSFAGLDAYPVAGFFGRQEKLLSPRC